jgi:predicted ATPase
VKYRYSQLDHSNLNWFANDYSVASLTEIQIVYGNLRGLNPLKIVFSYPISVIAGRNRSGKSTILALAACAFHNARTGFRLPERRLPYYTFSDFFIQSSEEVPPQGIIVRYGIMHNNWRKSKNAPEGIGKLYQSRSKRKGGKWSNYSDRVDRNVVFFGIQRVVPPVERSVARSYRSHFSLNAPAGWENKVKEVVGRILGTSYDNYSLKTHGRYRLSLVATHGIVYSGFNMGAGENTLFEIFSTIYASPRGTLLVIDEIELGLHEEAQERFIRELKRECNDRHIQVVSTTHSPAIIDAVPPEGRFFIETYPTKNIITTCISPQYAAGKLAGDRTDELDLFVEDGIAATMIEAALPNELRKRTAIKPIGSPPAIVRQMAARYKDMARADCLAIMDGDNSSKAGQLEKRFLDALESTKDKQSATQWFSSRLLFLPGQTWPERWLLQALQSTDCAPLASFLKLSEDEFRQYLEDAISAEEHDEIYTLANQLSIKDPKSVCCTLVNHLTHSEPHHFQSITEKIAQLLP